MKNSYIRDHKEEQATQLNWVEVLELFQKIDDIALDIFLHPPEEDPCSQTVSSLRTEHIYDNYYNHQKKRGKLIKEMSVNMNEKLHEMIKRL
jgi:hypothetical protein